MGGPERLEQQESSGKSGRLERLVFFGTPDFAVPSLEALIRSGRRPMRVVTQPSRRSGRGRRFQAPPVAQAAERHGIPVLQPRRVREPDFLDTVAQLEPQLAVVVAFGQIFPRSLLDIPEHGCLNVHASLLPAYRGAAPIQAAIAAGEPSTGVTTMKMDEGMDTGPMLLKRSLTIGESETAEELSRRLAALGGEALLETLEALEGGHLCPEPQGEEEASYAPQIRKEDGRVDWSVTAEELSNRLRAFTPWPGLTAGFRGNPVKLLQAEPVSLPASAALAAASPGDAGGSFTMPGCYLGLAGDHLAIRCGGDLALGVRRLQRAGRKPLDARDFVNGERLAPGETFE